jgi:hypothetical protein
MSPADMQKAGYKMVFLQAAAAAAVHGREVFISKHASQFAIGEHNHAVGAD